MHPAEQQRWKKLAQQAGSRSHKPGKVERKVTSLAADAPRLLALGLLQAQPQIDLAFSQWLEHLPRPVPVSVPVPAVPEVVTEIPEAPAVEVLAVEAPAVEVRPRPIFDAAVPSAHFLRALPYGGGSLPEAMVEARVPELSSRLFLIGLPWKGPQAEISLVEMMARATHDAVQRSQQAPAPVALASTLSSHDFLQQLPWNLGAER